MSERCRHKKTGIEYVIFAFGRVKIGEEWLDSVTYYNPETTDPYYTRTKIDFDSKFEII